MSLSSIVNEINSQLRQLSGNMQEGNQPASGSQLLQGQMVKNQRYIVLFTYQNHKILLYAGSIGSDAGNNPTNSEMNSTVFNGVGESSVSLPGVMSEHHGQKVCFLHYSRILFVTPFWPVLHC
jgi:hypothetical protein